MLKQIIRLTAAASLVINGGIARKIPVFFF
jgi:hypothetical protein